jgi:uncharacterized protein (DUF58 family)
MEYPYSLDQIHDFDNLELVAQLVVEGFITGLHKSPYHGFSVEFAEHRIYNPGESTRNVDWKLFGRTDRLYVKKFEEETNLRACLVLDTSSSMLFPYRDNRKISKLTFSAVCAAALINLLKTQRDAAGLALFSSEIHVQTGSRLTTTHLRWLFNELQKLVDPEFQPLNKTTSASDALHQIAESIHRRSLVIIFSDLLSDEDPGEVFSALQHLRHNKHDVILFHVTDRELEQDFAFRNRPYKFIDLESGSELKLNPNEIRSSYIKSMGERIAELKLRCGQFNIDLVEADINEPFRNVLQSFLVKRSKLF